MNYIPLKPNYTNRALKLTNEQLKHVIDKVGNNISCSITGREEDLFLVTVTFRVSEMNFINNFIDKHVLGASK